MKIRTIQKLFKGVDTYRPSLLNLHVTKDYLEFCDGFKLMRFNGENKTTGFIRKHEFDAVKAFPNSFLDTEEGFRNISIKKGIATKLEENTEDVNYPNTDMVWGTPHEAKATVKIGVDLLMRICEVIKSEYKDKGTGITFEIAKASEPVRGKCNDIEFILMPMRNDD